MCMYLLIYLLIILVILALIHVCSFLSLPIFYCSFSSFGYSGQDHLSTSAMTALIFALII